jgi:HK97 family phage portal protein
MKLFRRSAKAIAPGSVRPPARARASSTVTVDEALGLHQVYRAVEIIAIAVSQLSCGVWRRDQEIDAPSLIAKPDLSMPRAAFFETTAVDLATTGNAFWRKYSTGPGEPVVGLRVLTPSECAVHQNDNTGDLSYSWRGQRLEAWQMSHLQKLRRSGRLYGLGPIEAAGVELRGGIDLRDYAGTWFTESSIPNGLFTSDQHLNSEQAKEYKKQIKTLWSPNEPAILGSGLKYEPITLKPADAQFLESRTFSVTEVARMFGIPATYMLASISGSSDTYSNQEQADIAFVRYTLMSYLREIEMALSELLPRGQDVRFKIDGLLRTDTKTRYETHQLAIDSGIYDAAYARGIEGIALPATLAAPSVKELTDV